MTDEPSDTEYGAMLAKLYALQPGETLVYHMGAQLTCLRDNNNGLSAVAQLAWNLAKGGRVRLFQRKLGDNQYQYLAIGCGTQRHYNERPLKDEIADEFAAVS